MAKAYFMPTDDQGKCVWLSNLASKLGTYAATVGVTAGEVTAVQADNTFFAYVCDAKNKFSQNGQDWTAYKNAARDGGSLGAMPVAPTLAAAPTAVPADSLRRAVALCARN